MELGRVDTNNEGGNHRPHGTKIQSQKDYYFFFFQKRDLLDPRD